MVEKRLNSVIKDKYPGEKFKIHQIMSGSGGEYKFQIICNKTLFDKFSLYRKDKEWEVYSPILTTYWKQKSKHSLRLVYALELPSSNFFIFAPEIWCSLQLPN